MTLYTIGFMGVGRIGIRVARAVIKAGHSIVISNSLRRLQTDHIEPDQTSSCWLMIGANA